MFRTTPDFRYFQKFVFDYIFAYVNELPILATILNWKNLNKSGIREHIEQLLVSDHFEKIIFFPCNFESPWKKIIAEVLSEKEKIFCWIFLLSEKFWRKKSFNQIFFLGGVFETFGGPSAGSDRRDRSRFNLCTCIQFGASFMI